MLKKTIQYEDLDGNEITEDFYFNLNAAEVAELGVSEKGGLDAYMTQIVADENGREIMRIMKDIIGMSIGERSADGKRFIKNDEIRDNFMQSDAYSQLFLELVTNADSASSFIIAMLPAKLQGTAQENLAAQKQIENVELPAEPSEEGAPLWFREKRRPTQKELMEMPKEEMQLAFKKMNDWGIKDESQ